MSKQSVLVAVNCIVEVEVSDVNDAQDMVANALGKFPFVWQVDPNADRPADMIANVVNKAMIQDGKANDLLRAVQVENAKHFKIDGFYLDSGLILEEAMVKEALANKAR